MGAVTHPTAAARARSASEGGRTGPTCKAEGVRPSQGGLGQAARQPESALHTPVRKHARDILSKKKSEMLDSVCDMIRLYFLRVNRTVCLAHFRCAWRNTRS